MSWEWIAAIVVLLVLAVALPVGLRALRYRHLLRKYGDAEVARAIVEKRILQHMTRAQLLEAWGPPHAQEQRVTKTRTVEVFKYRPTARNRFRDKVTLEDGFVTGWDQK